MTIEAIQRFPITLAAGAQIDLPGSNYFFLYSLTGPDLLKVTFHQEAAQSAIADFPSGMAWGDGRPRVDGKLLFTRVTVKNTSATAATAVIYMSWTPVTANRFSGEVAITGGDVDADTYQGTIDYAEGNSENGSNAAAYDKCKDFCINHYVSGGIAAGNYAGMRLITKNGGDASYPHQIIITKIRYGGPTAGDWKLAIGQNYAASWGGGVTVSHNDLTSKNGTGTSAATESVWPGGVTSIAWAAALGAAGTSYTNKSPISQRWSGGITEVNFEKSPIVCEDAGSLTHAIRIIEIQNGDGTARPGLLSIEGKLITTGP